MPPEWTAADIRRLRAHVQYTAEPLPGGGWVLTPADLPPTPDDCQRWPWARRHEETLRRSTAVAASPGSTGCRGFERARAECRYFFTDRPPPRHPRLPPLEAAPGAPQGAGLLAGDDARRLTVAEPALRVDTGRPRSEVTLRPWWRQGAVRDRYRAEYTCGVRRGWARPLCPSRLLRPTVLRQKDRCYCCIIRSTSHRGVAGACGGSGARRGVVGSGAMGVAAGVGAATRRPPSSIEGSFMMHDQAGRLGRPTGPAGSAARSSGRSNAARAAEAEQRVHAAVARLRADGERVTLAAVVALAGCSRRTAHRVLSGGGETAPPQPGRQPGHAEVSAGTSGVGTSGAPGTSVPAATATASRGFGLGPSVASAVGPMEGVTGHPAPRLASVPSGPDWLSVRDFAAWLQVPPSCVYQEIHRGRLPALRVGRHLRVRRQDAVLLAER